MTLGISSWSGPEMAGWHSTITQVRQILTHTHKDKESGFKLCRENNKWRKGPISTLKQTKKKAPHLFLCKSSPSRHLVQTKPGHKICKTTKNVLYRKWKVKKKNQEQNLISLNSLKTELESSFLTSETWVWQNKKWPTSHDVHQQIKHVSLVRTTELSLQPLSTDEDHEMQSKALEKAIN